MSYLNFLFYLVFTIIVIIVIVCFLINEVVNKGLLFAIWQRIYLGFITFHSFYIFSIHVLIPENSFFSIITPLSLFYAPFYFSALYVLVPTDTFKFSKILKHFYITLILTVLYIVIAVFFMENIKLQLWYENMMYAIASLQFLFYAIISFIGYNRFSINPLVTSSMSQSLIFLLIASLFFVSLLIGNSGQISNKLNGLLMCVMILCAVSILFKYNLIIMIRLINTSGNELDLSGIRQIENRSSTNVASSINNNSINNENIIGNKSVKEKYQKSRIKKEEIEQYIRKVQKAMDEKIYLDTELSLEKISKKLKIPQYHLTQVFSIGFNSSFNKLINQYRVEYAIGLLKNTSDNLSIEEIGSQSGFTSRSSFYRAFNALYKISPTDYRKDVQAGKNI